MHQQKDIDLQGGYKNKTNKYAVTKNIPQIQGHLQTESKGMREGILHKWK